MALTDRQPIAPSHDDTIAPGVAAGAWFSAWVLGTFVLGGALIVAFGVDDGITTVPQMAAILAVGWSAYLAAAWMASRTAGTGDAISDLGVRFAPIDAVGVVLGVGAQLVLIPALYVPLRSFWPETFSDDAIGERSQEIVDRASGPMLLVLAVLLVVGAPLVEELVYRGLLQRSWAPTLGAFGSLIAVSALFAAIHFSPVEMPGLFVAGLVFGIGVVLTGRIGPGIIAHMAFNATAMISLL